MSKHDKQNTRCKGRQYHVWVVRLIERDGKLRAYYQCVYCKIYEYVKDDK